MENDCVGYADQLKNIASGDTFTLHFTLCTLYSVLNNTGGAFSLTYSLRTGTINKLCPSGGCPMQALYMILFAAGIVAADQITKYLTLVYIPLHAQVDVLPGVVGLTYVKNTGAAFSSFEGMQWLFAVIFILFTVAVIWEYKNKYMPFTPFERWCIAAIYGGGLGNMIDRVRFGYVVDMIETRFMEFPVFNVADCFITCGCIALMTHLILFNRNFWKDEKKKM